MKKNKQKTAERTTINGAVVHNVALSKNGIPQLSENMSYLTISRTSGSVRKREQQ